MNKLHGCLQYKSININLMIFLNYLMITGGPGGQVNFI